MEGLQLGSELNDQFASAIDGIISAANLFVNAMVEMQRTMNVVIDTSNMEAVREEINEATMDMNELNTAMQKQAVPGVMPPAADSGSTQVINTVINPVLPDPLVKNLEPVRPQIQPNAPPEVFQNLDSLTIRIDILRERIQQIGNNPVSMGTAAANTEIEMMSFTLNQALQGQNKLNQAMQGMKVSDINASYLHLSQTIGIAGQHIRNNTDTQGSFNREISQGASLTDNLINKIKKIAGNLLNIETLGKALELSDTMTQTTARMNLLVNDNGSVEELQNKIFASSQNARASYLATADAVSKLGLQAGNAFSSNDELIAFTELLNKEFVIAGTPAQEIDSVMQQITQAMAEGGLQSGDLSTIKGSAAPIVEDIQRYLKEVQGIDADNIEQLASEGVLTADVIKEAMFYAAEDIDKKFNTMPMTWAQIWQSMQNTALTAFQPVLQKLQDVANSETFQTFVSGVIGAMGVLANIVQNIFNLIGTVGGFIVDNWSVIAPLILGVVAAWVAYNAVLGVYNTIQAISSGLQAISAAATTTATGAQAGLNTALLACPLTWIILLIIVLIAIIFAVCSAIAKMTGVAESGFGVICGGINVVLEFVRNLTFSILNIALGIGNAISTLCSNVKTAFHNAICSVQSWWYNLLATVLDVVAGICESLNKLPFVEFDYSGITSAADEYAAKANEAEENKEDYKSIGDAFNEGMSTFDTFREGWISKAFDAGASWGDGVAEAVGNFSLSDIFGSTDIPDQGDYTSGFDGGTGDPGIGENVGNIAEDTASMKDTMDITEEDLKYLRDLAEQETVNRYTVAEVSVDMSGMKNTVNNGDDLDGFISRLTDSVNEAVNSITEGVHE